MAELRNSAGLGSGGPCARHGQMPWASGYRLVQPDAGPGGVPGGPGYGPEGPVDQARVKDQCRDARWECQVLVVCLGQSDELSGTGLHAVWCGDWGLDTPRLLGYVTSALAMNYFRVPITTSKQNGKR